MLCSLEGIIYIYICSYVQYIYIYMIIYHRYAHFQSSQLVGCSYPVSPVSPEVSSSPQCARQGRIQCNELRGQGGDTETHNRYSFCLWCYGVWLVEHKTGWWFQGLFIFTLTWGDDPIWLIFFKWVETTNQKMLRLLLDNKLCGICILESFFCFSDVRHGESTERNPGDETQLVLWCICRRALHSKMLEVAILAIFLRPPPKQSSPQPRFVQGRAWIL